MASRTSRTAKSQSKAGRSKTTAKKSTTANGKSAASKSARGSKSANGKAAGAQKALAPSAAGAKASSSASGRYSLGAIRQELDRFLEEFSSSFSLMPLGRKAIEVEPFRRLQTALTGSLPAVDMVERTKEFRITAELPGMERKDIELTVSDDVLTIKGEKKSEKEQKKNYHLAERRYGAFERSFRLPDGASTDAIDASFRQGVLTVTMSKAKNDRPRERRISVRGS